jgi:hypothetical protein
MTVGVIVGVGVGVGVVRLLAIGASQVREDHRSTKGRTKSPVGKKEDPGKGEKRN